MAEQVNPEAHGAHMERTQTTYGEFLHLEKLLTAQQGFGAGAPDELLFVIQHQVTELWMKLLLHELDLARKSIAADALPPAFKGLARVSRILEQMNSSWDVLRTMTPSDYTRFRGALGTSSGFQSAQYRLLEYSLGNRNLAMKRPHGHDPDATARLEAELARPSLYQEVLHFAHRQGMALPDLWSVPSTAPHEAVAEVTAMWAKVYRDTDRYWTLYEMAEKLVDLEDYFRRWRFNHVTTVERVIGFKRGTGGTGGVDYLKRMLEVELFPELWRVRTEL